MASLPKTLSEVKGKRRPRCRGRSYGASHILLITSVCFVAGCGDGVPDFTAEDLAETTEQVRTSLQLQDYEYGAELGERWAEWAPDALELKAWTVANLAKAGSGGLAKKMAGEMMASHPDSPWSSFALAAARVWSYDRNELEKTLEASEVAMDGLPDLVEAVTLRNDALFRFQGPDSAKAFLDALPPEIQARPAIRFLNAMASFPMELEPPDSAVDEARRLLEDVLGADPGNIDANVFLSSLLETFKNDPAGGLTYLERAAAQTPSPTVHAGLWSRIFANSALTDEEKRERVSADVGKIVEEGGESPARLAALASGLGGMDMPDLQTELEEQVLKKYSTSRAAEVVLGNRYRALRRELWGAPPAEGAETAEKRHRLMEMVVDFIHRPRHQDPELLLDAHWTRFLLDMADSDSDPTALVEAANGLAAQMEVEPGPDPAYYYAVMARALAEYPQTLDDARRFIELGRGELEAEGLAGETTGAAGEAAIQETETEEMEPARPEVMEGDEQARPSEEGIGEDAEEEESPEEKADRAMFSAITGLILIQEGRLDEAEEALALARDLDPENYNSSPVLLFSYLYSGRLMEKRAESARADGSPEEIDRLLASADEYYLEGVRQDYYPSPSDALPWTNPNEVALEALYEKRNGSLDGFQEYLLSAKDEEWAERREKILAGRIAEPEPMTAFALETLDGEEVTSESFLGRVVVINFWGTW